MAYPNDLLEQAYHLARRERKRPRQASLRRAISTAYYALFHLLISESVKNWKRRSERPALARMFDHSTMARACGAKRDEIVRVMKKSNQRLAASEIQQLQELLRVVQTFVEMRSARERADYDGSANWTRTQVLSRIDLVDEAFESWRRIHDQPAAQTFLASLLLRDRRS
jgi:uncharacterized protein (UPF0332 family)